MIIGDCKPNCKHYVDLPGECCWYCGKQDIITKQQKIKVDKLYKKLMSGVLG